MSEEERVRATQSSSRPQPRSTWFNFRWPFVSTNEKEVAERSRPAKGKDSRRGSRSIPRENEDVYVQIEDERILRLVPSPSGIWSRLSKRTKRIIVFFGFVFIYFVLFENPRIAHRRAKSSSFVEGLDAVSVRYNQRSMHLRPEALLKHLEASTKKKEEEVTMPVNYALLSRDEDAKKKKAAAKATAPPPVEGASPSSVTNSNQTRAGPVTRRDIGAPPPEGGPPMQKPPRRRRRKRKRKRKRKRRRKKKVTAPGAAGAPVAAASPVEAQGASAASSA